MLLAQRKADDNTRGRNTAMEKRKAIWNRKNKDQQVFWLSMAAAAAATILLM